MSRRAPDNNEYRLKFNISKGLVSSSKLQNVQVPDLFMTVLANHVELPGLLLHVLINDILVLYLFMTLTAIILTILSYTFPSLLLHTSLS